MLTESPVKENVDKFGGWCYNIVGDDMRKLVVALLICLFLPSTVLAFFYDVTSENIYFYNIDRGQVLFELNSAIGFLLISPSTKKCAVAKESSRLIIYWTRTDYAAKAACMRVLQ